MGRKPSTVITSVKGAALITAVDLGVAVLGSAAIAVDPVAILGLLMLLESAALMLLGGALSFSGQPGIRKLSALLTKTETKIAKVELEDLDAKAAAYALVGVLLFVESLVLSAATL